MNIPLVNNNSVDAINTSLIAIKKTVNSNNQIQDVDVNVGINIATNCTYCAASSTTIKGAQLYNGCSIKVLFTSAITGSDTTTPMSINYNGVSIPVKTGKNGVLSNFVANNIDGSYIYCQAYTTLELLFDGTQFIIMGNPVVISSADYTIYTDGSTIYNDRYFFRSLSATSREDFISKLVTAKGSVAYQRYVVLAQIMNVGFYTGVVGFSSNSSNYFAILSKRGGSGELWNCENGVLTVKTITAN